LYCEALRKIMDQSSYLNELCACLHEAPGLTETEDLPQVHWSAVGAWEESCHHLAERRGLGRLGLVTESGLRTSLSKPLDKLFFFKRDKRFVIYINREEV
jgi:hypothetical protein